MARDDDADGDDELAALRRRRKAKAARKRTLLYTGLAVGAGVLLVVVLFVAFRPLGGGSAGAGGRAPTFGGPSNHAELADLIRQKGFVVEVESGGPWSTPDRPMSFFRLTGPGPKHPRLMVHLNKSESAADEHAKTMGENGFQFGRFVIEEWQHDDGHRAAYLQLRKALVGR